MEFFIEKAVKNQYPQLIELFKEFAAFENLEHTMTNTVEQMLAEKDLFYCFVVKTSENKIIGYASYFFTYFTWSGKSIYMEDLYLKPDYRGRGIGTKLMNKVIEVGKHSNCKKLRWQVSNWNTTAINFYKKMGAEINVVEQNCDLNL